ncbi:hypothetical protein CaCOL14_006732 [Colletotrichum acutatum]
MSQSPIWGTTTQPFSEPSSDLASLTPLPSRLINGQKPLPLGSSTDIHYNETIRPASAPTSNATRMGNPKRVRSQITKGTISGRPRGDNTASDELEDAKEETEDDEADAPASKRLACPFYTFDRVRHLRCAHFHLKRVKDVKQHLLRKHRFHCRGCYEGFKDKEKFRDHARNSQQCQAGTGNSQSAGIEEGFSEDQVSVLQQRINPRDEDHSWYSIWKILFPGQPTPASPFLKSDVEEVISTVCELWEKNIDKVMFSLGNAPFSMGSITNAELSEQISHSESETPVKDDLLRLLGELAKVSVPRGNTDGRYVSIAQPSVPTSAPGSASAFETASTHFFDSERLQASDTMVCSLKAESPGNARPTSKKKNERSRRSARKKR